MFFGRPMVQTDCVLLQSCVNRFENVDMTRGQFFEAVTDTYNNLRKQGYPEISQWIVRCRINRGIVHEHAASTSRMNHSGCSTKSFPAIHQYVHGKTTTQRAALSPKPDKITPVHNDNRVIQLTGTMTVVINLNLGTITVTK